MRFILPCFTLCAVLLLSTGYSRTVFAQKSGSTPAYTFTDLPGLPGLIYNGRAYTQSDAWAINDTDEIVGDSYTHGPTSVEVERHPVIWRREASGAFSITDLLLGGNHWP